MTKLTLKKVEAVISSLENGHTIKRACNGARISRQTFYKWKDKKSENEQRVLVALDNSRVLEAEDSLFAQAMKGNPTCLIFYLCNRAPHRWKRMDSMNITNANIIEKLPVIVQIEKDDAGEFKLKT